MSLSLESPRDRSLNPAVSDRRRPASRRPGRDEAAAYYLPYIDRITSDDVVGVLQQQLDRALACFSTISEEKSLHRYAADKWSVRQVLNHVNDTERVILSRALWFARGFESPLPSYEPVAASVAADADGLPWARHVAEFRSVRMGTLSLFENLPEQGWDRRGIASDNPFSVRALAYIIAGHLDHHLAILLEKY